MWSYPPVRSRQDIELRLLGPVHKEAPLRTRSRGPPTIFPGLASHFRARFFISSWVMVRPSSASLIPADTWAMK